VSVKKSNTSTVVPSSETPVLREVKVVDVRTKNKSKVEAMEVRAAAHRPRTGQTDGIKVDVLVRMEILPRINEHISCVSLIVSDVL
jgi:hypothetical protein